MSGHETRKTPGCFLDMKYQPCFCAWGESVNVQIEWGGSIKTRPREWAHMKVQ